MFLTLSSAHLWLTWPSGHSYTVVFVKLSILHCSLTIPRSLKNKNPTTRLAKSVPAAIFIKCLGWYFISVFVYVLRKEGWGLRDSVSMLLLLHKAACPHLLPVREQHSFKSHNTRLPWSQVWRFLKSSSWIAKVILSVFSLLIW